MSYFPGFLSTEQWQCIGLFFNKGKIALKKVPARLLVVLAYMYTDILRTPFSSVLKENCTFYYHVKFFIYKNEQTRFFLIFRVHFRFLSQYIHKNTYDDPLCLSPLHDAAIDKCLWVLYIMMTFMTCPNWVYCNNYFESL